MKTLLSLLFTAMISLAVIPSTYAGKRSLQNGYKIDPQATMLVENLARVFTGLAEFRKSESGCTLVTIRYGNIDRNGVPYNKIAWDADEKGDRNGYADKAELESYYQTACQNWGK